jgi:hypothetical protein
VNQAHIIGIKEPSLADSLEEREQIPLRVKFTIFADR